MKARCFGCVVLLALAGIVACPLGRADEVELVDGTRYKGKIIEEGATTIVIEMVRGGGAMRVALPLSKVRAITSNGKRRVLTGHAAQAPALREGPNLSRRRSYGAGKKLFLLFDSLSQKKAMYLAKAKEQTNTTTRTTGGLCVQIGCTDLGYATEAARTGRFLVHVLDTDAASVAEARHTLQERSLYGLVSVDCPAGLRKLPYAANLVNVLIVEPQASSKVAARELSRVLCPNGVLFAAAPGISAGKLKSAGLVGIEPVRAAGAWLAARKPWPAEMGTWTHARHGPDGNAVSGDMLVGPPRCVQWISGPPQEINYLVCSAGRNFYAAVLARDSFNGLKLWQHSLRNAKPYCGAELRPARGRAWPVAAGELLFAVRGNKVVALDAATGETVGEYPAAGTPSDLLYVAGTLIAVDKQCVRAVDAHTGKLVWEHKAAEPRCVVAGDGAVFLLQGLPRRGERCALASLELKTGAVRWQRGDVPWAGKIRRLVCSKGLLACEISTFSDDEAGNGIHVVSASDGKHLWERTFIPGLNHNKQARAIFVGGLLWILEKGRKCVGLDPRTGEARKTHKAGWCHCFPPVATRRYLLSGEMSLTDLDTGAHDFNPITKQACGRQVGLVPANGLINVFPKHCVCWPMLRGYAALAPADAGDDTAGRKPEDLVFPLERGVRPGKPAGAPDQEWPCYRHDAWRSGSTTAGVSTELKTLWTASLGGLPDGPIADDWRQNPFVKGPVTSPVVAGGLVFVARPDAHELVALDARTGKVRWRFTANGRIDSPPTVHRGVCLFGAKSGWVYCVRVDTGEMVWRLRAAPREKRIVAYGQLESPWPVPGSVIVVDDVAYFAAGRQSLADGGILVFAVAPARGRIRWVKRLNTVPQKNFYACNAQGIDNFDLLHREGDCIAMSHWLFDRRTGDMLPVKKKHGFALIGTGGSGVAIARGFWSYAPRQEPRRKSDFRGVRPYVRPLAVFRDDASVGCTEDKRSLYRRDFDFAGGEKFNFEWLTGWSTAEASRKGKGEVWRSQRLARGAEWTASVFPQAKPGEGVAAMVLAGDTVFVVGMQGGLTAVALEDGRSLFANGARLNCPPPVWDGMAAAYGCLFVATKGGDVICLGNLTTAGIPSPN